MKKILCFSIASYLILSFVACSSKTDNRSRESFDTNWQFHLGDVPNGQLPGLDDSGWRTLNLPHDWSIEGKFSEDNPAGARGGALPGGIGWYRKTFKIPASDKDKMVFIDFDGVYRNSEVWINGHYLGKRPYGFSSFRYDLTPYLKYGNEKNSIAVKVDNSEQPNSRWYSGSGIYRNVWLVKTGKLHIDHWGTFVSTPEVSEESAKVSLQIKVRNHYPEDKNIQIKTQIVDSQNKQVASIESKTLVLKDSTTEIIQGMDVSRPAVCRIGNPNLYKAVSQVEVDGKVEDEYETQFGIRLIKFDREKGFLLNGKQVKILGVCNHHDLGCLGAAINTRALQRQLEILKAMGCNAIRTSHNPPAPELLDLCDKMGFLVMDEAFDMWKMQKTKFDYHLDWDQWHKRDLQDLIVRDRNHPSVVIWSIGNEIREQGDSTGIPIARELAGIVKDLDTTRPVTSACNHVSPNNFIIRSGALDVIGTNYHQQLYDSLPEMFPGGTFTATETTSALATRGEYDMPSDSIRRWPKRWDKPFTGNPDLTCSSYDNCSVPWGSTHEETWKVIKKYDFLSGMFIWTGFDYLGEPTPYTWPARSSYFGIIDLAGFPKDAYYMYQSEWTDKPVLHLFPHWNWNKGDTVDVWAYTNANEVELFLNGQSLGVQKKTGDALHLMWRIPFSPGTLKAVGRKDGKEIATDEVKTAGKPAKIELSADRANIKADGKDLSFVTVKITDKDGTVVPHADNLVNFELSGNGSIVGVDNGLQTSHEPFKAKYRKAFNGLCLAVVQSTDKSGGIELKAVSDGLESATIEIATE